MLNFRYFGWFWVVRMWLWVFVGRCRWFWVVMKWFRLVVGGLGWSWVVVDSFGPFLLLVSTQFCDLSQEF